MKDISMKTIAGAVAGILSYFLGGFDLALQTLLFFMVVDYITGTIKAVMKKELDFQKSAEGFAKKVMYLVVVAVAVRIDLLTGANGTIRIFAIYGYIGTEIYSITQNLIVMEVIPENIAKYFKTYSEGLMKVEK
jgi:toxin secretion/phage lysis holin